MTEITQSHYHCISTQLFGKEVQLEIAYLRYEYSKNVISIVNNQLCVWFKNDRISYECSKTMVQFSVHAAVVVLI